MNIKKVISRACYGMLLPVAQCLKLQKSRMTLEEARSIVAGVYDLNRSDSIFGGGVNL